MGRTPEEAEGGKEAWHMTPGPLPSLGDGCRVVWVGARGNQTFVAVNESLVFDQNLGRCHVFADKHTIGQFRLVHTRVLSIIE